MSCPARILGLAVVLASTTVVADDFQNIHRTDCPNGAQPPADLASGFAATDEAPTSGEVAQASYLGEGVESKGKSACCEPRCSIFAEYLFLTPRDAEIAYAIPINGPIVAGDPRIPVGPAALVDPGYESGFRAGFGVPLDCSSRLVGTYTWYSNDVTDSATVSPTDLLNPLVIHPSTVDAATDVLNASADLAIDFQLADIDYELTWFDDGYSRWQALVGARYAHLDQIFTSQYDFNGTTNVLSEVNFDGGGVRLGLDAERHFHGCIVLYARGIADFLAGDFQGRYSQTDVFNGTVTDLTWNSSRVVTILEVELGLGWKSCDGRWRITAGYLFNGWLNAVQPDEMILAGQTNDFTDMGDGLSFDGLVARGEFRF